LNVENRDDVFMVEVSEQLHLSQSSETEHGVIERGDFLDGNFLAGRLVDGGAVDSILLANRSRCEDAVPSCSLPSEQLSPAFVVKWGSGTRNHTVLEYHHSPDNTVSSFTNNILNLILIRDVERDAS
jgi:hypothetical protein